MALDRVTSGSCSKLNNVPSLLPGSPQTLLAIDDSHARHFPSYDSDVSA